MKRLFFLLLAFVMVVPFLLSSESVMAAEKKPEAEKKPSIKYESSGRHKPPAKHTPLSDEPLTRAERIELEKEKKRKAWEEKKRTLPPINMKYVRGGCFNMGDWTGTGDDDEVPVHEVCLSDYYIAEAEVTNELWEHVMGWSHSEGLDPKMPIVGVSWAWANVFIGVLNRLTDGFYRFPTEAEWEYAARERGKNIRWSGTDNDESIEDYGWFYYNSDGKLHYGKEKKPNALGLYDMTGNAWEWVEDNFDFDYYKVSDKNDPYGPDFSSWRTIRGGSFMSDPNKLRTTYRYAQEPNLRSPVTGFRLAE
ncbi:MAG: formylglycine-generating enzyme family protein [Thermodesulfobacteriota bacterium]